MTWIDVNDRLPKGSGGVLKVKRENGDELKAYYHADKVAWVNFFGQKTSHFQDFNTNKFLFDVTHWFLPAKTLDPL